MAAGIFGYFRFNIHGNSLSGDYMNWETSGLEIERGNKVNGNPDEFSGDYKTNWNDQQTRSSDLNILRIDENTFQLLWTLTSNPDAGVQYRGRGIIRNKEMFGFYELLP